MPALPSRDGVARTWVVGRRTGDRTAQTAALFELARAERQAGRLDRAEELSGEALESAADGDQLKHALILNNLGMLSHDRGKLNAAFTSFESVVATRRRILGDVHPSVAGALSNLGRSARMAGRSTDAAEAYEEVLQIYDQTLEPDHYPKVPARPSTRLSASTWRPRKGTTYGPSAACCA